MAKAKDRPVCVWAKPCRTASECAEWLRQYQRTKKPGQPGLRSYRCNACGWWHITKQDARTAAARGKRARRRQRGIF